jgi:hypothetical protein
MARIAFCGGGKRPHESSLLKLFLSRWGTGPEMRPGSSIGGSMLDSSGRRLAIERGMTVGHREACELNSYSAKR